MAFRGLLDSDSMDSCQTAIEEHLDGGGTAVGQTSKNRWATVVVRLRLSLSPAEYVVELCLVAVGGHLRSACTFVKLIPMNKPKELVLWSRVVLGRV